MSRRAVDIAEQRAILFEQNNVRSNVRFRWGKIENRDLRIPLLLFKFYPRLYNIFSSRLYLFFFLLLFFQYTGEGSWLPLYLARAMTFFFPPRMRL